jgi:hypothetical protein
VEVTSAAAVAWQFAAEDPQRRERRAMRVIAWSPPFLQRRPHNLDDIRTAALADGVTHPR